MHPPVGKWLIAAGEALFGMNSFGWRVAPLVFGTLLVLVTIRLVRRVSKSTLVGGLAGLLLAFDGLAFVMSRTALLDIFVAFFVVAAVSCLAADRDWFRNRLADHLERHELPDLARPVRAGPGCAALAAGRRRVLRAGHRQQVERPVPAGRVRPAVPGLGRRGPSAGRGRTHGADSAVLRDGVPAFVSLVVLAGVVYLGTWAGWLSTSGGYDRDWGANNPDARTVQAARRAAGVAGCTTRRTSGTSTPATSSTTPSTPTGPTRRAGWSSPGRSGSTRSTTSSPARTAASARTTASG